MLIVCHSKVKFAYKCLTMAYQRHFCHSLTQFFLFIPFVCELFDSANCIHLLRLVNFFCSLFSAVECVNDEMKWKIYNNVRKRMLLLSFIMEHLTNFHFVAKLNPLKNGKYSLVLFCRLCKMGWHLCADGRSRQFPK